MIATTHLTRMIRVYPCDGDEMAFEIKMPEINNQTLHDIFGIHLENPMFDVYRIDAQIAKHLSALIGDAITFDFDKFEYYMDYV